MALILERDDMQDFLTRNVEGYEKHVEELTEDQQKALKLNLELFMWRIQRIIEAGVTVLSINRESVSIDAELDEEGTLHIAVTAPGKTPEVPVVLGGMKIYLEEEEMVMKTMFLNTDPNAKPSKAVEDDDAKQEGV